MPRNINRYKLDGCGYDLPIQSSLPTNTDLVPIMPAKKSAAQKAEKKGGDSGKKAGGSKGAKGNQAGGSNDAEASGSTKVSCLSYKLHWVIHGLNGFNSKPN
jgi:hypothetical protein